MFTLLAAGAGQARGLDDSSFVFVEGLLCSSCSLRLDMLVEETLRLAAQIQRESLQLDAAEH